MLLHTSIRIRNGKFGFVLSVNGACIRRTHTGFPEAYVGLCGGIPAIATQWVSIQAIREYWAKYRLLILASTRRPSYMVVDKWETRQATLQRMGIYHYWTSNGLIAEHTCHVATGMFEAYNVTLMSAEQFENFLSGY